MKILVALSGGIDSTAVAKILKDKGYELEGVYMKLHNSPSFHEKNIKKVKEICNLLDIKYHILDLRESFQDSVYKPFVESYIKGETPNPCILCNRFIKFGKLVEFAKKNGFDKLATGHYASICDDFICESKDKTKDQSYFLADIKKEYIPFLLFPLSNKTKKQIKDYVSQIPQINSYKKEKESQEICFVDTTYIDTLKKHISTDKVGKVLDMDGKIIGEHQGYIRYTIGQRKGFKVFIAHEPHYVIAINPQKNEITVGKKEDLFKNSFFIKKTNMFINTKTFQCSLKIRYRSKKVTCFVEILQNNRAKITTKEPVSSIARGQMAVFYDKERVIGGGWIE